jgi:hypothetical protein
MKIISSGELPNSVFKGTCRNCKTVFECTEKDFKYPDFRGTKVVRCPLPGCFTEIVADSFPILR